MKNNYYNIALIMWASIIAWAINYAYYPLMLQYMTLEDFWVFGSIMWVLNLIWVISTGIILFLNKEISKNIWDTGRVKYIFVASLKILSVVWLIGTLIFWMFTPLLARYFDVSEYGYFILIGTTIFLSFVSTVVQSSLRWLKQFNYLSFSQIIGPVMKLMIWIWLVYLGYNIYWAIYWVVLSGLISLWISILYLKFIFQWTSSVWKTSELLKDFRNNKKEIIKFFLISFFFALFLNIDVIFVQNIFDATSAGAYVGIAVLGKFLIFLLLSIETVYYGQILEHSKATVPRHLILNPLVIMTLVVVSALVFNVFFWNFILHILKPELTEYFDIYLWSLMYYGLLAYMSFFSKILVWWNSNYANKLLAACSILLVIVVYTLWTSSLENFIYSFVWVWCITTILLAVLFYFELTHVKK